MNIDTMVHRLYNSRLLLRLSQAACPKCGTGLTTAYHENCLYSVHCENCNTITLVRAKNPQEAAAKVGYCITKETAAALLQLGAQVHGEV